MAARGDTTRCSGVTRGLARVTVNPSVERTSYSWLRRLQDAAHVKRYAFGAISK